MEVGVIGPGRMGADMVRRLMRAGEPHLAHDSSTNAVIRRCRRRGNDRS